MRLLLFPHQIAPCFATSKNKKTQTKQDHPLISIHTKPTAPDLSAALTFQTNSALHQVIRVCLQPQDSRGGYCELRWLPASSPAAFWHEMEMVRLPSGACLGQLPVTVACFSGNIQRWCAKGKELTVRQGTALFTDCCQAKISWTAWNNVHWFVKRVGKLWHWLAVKSL